MTLVDRYLHEQQLLTAVERFAQRYEADGSQLRVQHYSTLLPASPPQPGEQYAFEVDLDSCSGCKACVVACNSLNGLDETETWRDVGLLHGGSSDQPFLQHVTAACHHCLDPACLNVCPVRAYEKDEATGIVRHLDDQCIGCQYCILACPYDVPKYNAARGIVRKCDMCSNRLAVGEAPACVQSCPNGAIRITTVRVQEVAENCEAGAFLPGAPDSHCTQPTTHYKTNRAFPRNALPADYFSVQPEHAHWPLVSMLVLTQLSVGA
ncbi:MAG TPA: 4Fe-4S dicluster domain-containing protein, partial [Planctomycetaceae bacterium]